jgi:cysteine synthase A
VTTETASRIEGIGRQRVEPSFIHTAIDRMMHVPDAASIATIHVCEEFIGRRVGASTGTGLWAAFEIAGQMIRADESGSIVTLLCDGGERYADKYYNAQWLADQGLHVEDYADQLRRFLGLHHRSPSAQHILGPEDDPQEEGEGAVGSARPRSWSPRVWPS